MEFLRRGVERLGGWTLTLPFAYMIAISILSHQEGGEKEVLGYSFRISATLGNSLHVPLYYLLGMFWLLAFEWRRFRGLKASLLAFVLATVFGAIDEYHQSFVPGRYPSVMDGLLDGLGAALATVTWPWVGRLFFSPDRFRRD